METIATMIKRTNSVFTRNQGDRRNSKELNTPGFIWGTLEKLNQEMGVGINCRKVFESYFLDMKKLGDWIIVLKLVEEGETFHMMSTAIHPRYD